MNSKKNNEKWIINLFIERYKKGNIVLVREQESPDFIVALDGKEIGVELTEIFQDSNVCRNGSSKLQQSSAEGKVFTERFISSIQTKVPFTFSVGIHFNKTVPIKKSNREEILKELEEICLPRIINLKNHGSVELEEYDGLLPPEIEHISIERFDGMKESFDFRPEGGTVSRLTINHLEPILSKKEMKLPSYLNCNEQWLLIREGNYYAGSFSSVEIDFPIDSLFDKVFLYRTRTNEIIALK